jgi:hypothetical protein
MAQSHQPSAGAPAPHLWMLGAPCNAGQLCLGDTLKLALFTQVGFELGKNAQHIQERLAGRGTGINGLFCGLESGTLGLHGANDVLQVADTASEPAYPA